MKHIKSKYREIVDQLEKEGKVTVLNRPADMAAIEALNKKVRENKRRYQKKESDSLRRASQIILR